MALPYKFTVSGYSENARVGANFDSLSTSVGQLSFNVKDYGAKGDGVNEDAPFIQAAIDAASSGVIYFPPGAYICSSRLVVKSNITLMGAGKYISTISLPQSNINPMDFSLIENTATLTNFRMQSLGLKGNRAFQTTVFTNGASDGYCVGFFFGPISNVFFDDLYIREFGATGAALNTSGGGILIVPVGSDSTCSDIYCTNVQFGNNDKISGFYVDAAEGTVGGGRNIVVRGCSFAGGGNNNAAYVLGGYGASTASKVLNVLIEDNLFYLTENVDACAEVNGVFGFSISNNKYVFTSTGVGQTALVRSDCSNGSIVGNTILSYNADTAKPTLSLVAFTGGEFQDNIVIAGNSFYVDNAAANDLIKIVKGSRRIVVRDNVFVGKTTSINRAMSIGECSDVEIVGNIFKNVVISFVISAGTNPSTARIGIRNNRFEDCGGSGSVQIVTTGGAIALTELEVDGNILTNPKSTAGGASFAAISTTATTGNILTGNKIYGSLPIVDAITNWALLERNIGYNPVGISTITPGASPYTYTAGKTHETVYIYGGTVSDVSVGSSTTAAASPTVVELPAGIAVVVTYAVAPTMKKYIH